MSVIVCTESMSIRNVYLDPQWRMEATITARHTTNWDDEDHTKPKLGYANTVPLSEGQRQLKGGNERYMARSSTRTVWFSENIRYGRRLRFGLWMSCDL